MKLTVKNLGFSILVLLGLILALSPVDKMSQIEISTDEMIYKINNKSNYISVDEVAHMIIDKDPSIQIIDIRSEKDYKDYHIPVSYSLPLEKLLSDYKDILNKEKIIVLVSNGNTNAGQAWILLQSMGYTDIFILQGGMNHWVKTFSNPQPLTQVAADDEVFKYQFRKAAGSALMEKGNIQQDEQVTFQKPKHVVKKKKKKNTEEGC